MKIKAVLFFFVGRCRFSGETILCLFNKMEHFLGKFPWRASFIVHSHLKISNIHYILIKLENSCVLGRKMKKIMKINNEKSQIWTLSLWTPFASHYGGGGVSSSAISPLKIWDVLPHYLRIDTVREKNRKLIILTIFAWTTSLIVEYSNHKILPFLDCNVTTN